MVNGEKQKPSGGMRLRARGLGLGLRPATGQRLPRSAGRRSPTGYVAAGFAVLALLGAWSLGLVGCSTGGSGYASGSVLDGMRQSPGEISRLRQNAHYYLLMGRPELGLKEMEVAHQQNPDNLQIVNLLAQNYEELGEFESARQLYQEALTRRGFHPVMTNNFCFSYYQEGRWQEAETCFRQALARDPNNVAARNNLGLLYCRVGRQDEARQLWQEAEGVAAADAKQKQALAALGMSDRAVYARRTESGPPVTEATQASAPQLAVAPVPTPAPAKDNSLAMAVAPKVTTPPASTPAPVEAGPQPEPVKVTPPVATGVTVAPAPAKDNSLAMTVAPKVTTPPAPVEARPQPEPVKVIPPVAARVTVAPAPPKDNSLAQTVSPKALEPRLASKPPAKTSDPVPANPRKEAQKRVAVSKPALPAAKTTPASTPGAAKAPLAAPVPAAAPAPVKPRTPIKSEQQVAQSPEAQTPGKVKALPQANILEAVDSACLTSLVEASVLFFPKYLTCAELVCTSIEVRNGTRTKDLARHTRSRLSLEGFSVAKIGNHVDFGVTQTTIFYRPGAERVARVVASAFFPGAGLEPSQKLKKGMDVKILLGADLLQRPQLMARLVNQPK